MENITNIPLNDNELLVLSDLISRINKSRILDTFFVDQAEQRMLWNLECLLEKNTPNIFSPDYTEDVKRAREAIRDKG
jgi:hypothetical protein